MGGGTSLYLNFSDEIGMCKFRSPQRMFPHTVIPVLEGQKDSPASQLLRRGSPGCQVALPYTNIYAVADLMLHMVGGWVVE